MSTSRRDFLKISSLSLVSAAAFGALSFRPIGASGQTAKLPLVPVTDPLAMNLGYNPDATKVDTKKWVKRAGADGQSQFCHNCLLFNSAKPTTEAQAPCSLFPGKAVLAKGWCNSWAKNPSAK